MKIKNPFRKSPVLEVEERTLLEHLIEASNRDSKVTIFASDGKLLAFFGAHTSWGWCWCLPEVKSVPTIGDEHAAYNIHARFSDRGRQNQDAGLQ